MKAWILAGLLAAVVLASADTITLRNGSRLQGTFVGGDSRSVRFTVGNQVNTYSLTDIESIEFSGAASSGNFEPSATYPPAPPYPPSAPEAPVAPVAPAAPAVADAGPAEMQIPAGTQLVVRLIDPVDSDRDALGQRYRASLDQPVYVNGEMIVPRGADVIAQLVNSQQSGKIKGRTSMTLELRSVVVNGRQYGITTAGVVEASKSRGARSAKVIGGAAALGALIGGIAGGGAGAAIGAGSGAAVGTAAEVVTSGQHVRIPSETRLTFTLQQPLNI